MIKIEESFLLVEILPIEVEKFNGFGKASGSLQDIVCYFQRTSLS